MGPGQPNRPFTSFLIKDILRKPNSYKRASVVQGQFRLSPFLTSAPGPSCSRRQPVSSAATDSTNETKTSSTPLDALFKMTNKTFEGLDNRNIINVSDATKREHFHIFGSKSQPSKKRRKSRTAFTNQQIYELEKRFLYQKYLTPADRDEIAQSLNLTNAQVITWFQNRRAKLKRDLEELKADVTHTTDSLASSDEEGEQDHNKNTDPSDDSCCIQVDDTEINNEDVVMNIDDKQCDDEHSDSLH